MAGERTSSTLAPIARNLRICFLLPGLGPSGGVGAVLAHARGLAADHGMRVTLAVPRPAPDGRTKGIRTIPVGQALGERYDIAVATSWHMAYALFDVRADRRAYFLQNFGERVYRPGDVERLGAPITSALPVFFITEGRWIARLLADLRPDAPCYHVANGIDKDVFAPPAAVETADSATPLRILLEGSQNLWFKGIDSALAATGRMTEARTVTLVTPEPPASSLSVDRVLGPLALDQMSAVYAETDVLLKLARVEGVFTPPLEAFHLGATCVVWPVTGHEEYVVHGYNGIVAEWDDLHGTARWLDLLTQDRELLHRLRTGALETARAWPSREQSTAVMAAALHEIAAAPAPPVESAMAQLLAELRAGMEDLRREQLAAKRREVELRTGIAWREQRHLELTASRTYRLSGRLQRTMALARFRRGRP